VHASLVSAAPGESIEVEALTPARARGWGMALARLHRYGSSLGTAGLPEWFAELDRPGQLFGADPRLAEAAAALAAALHALPRDDTCYGFVHGDFELDNLAWVGASSVAYDFDEAGRSWFVADIAQAVRDLQPAPAAIPAAGAAPGFAAFLAGYREVRTLTETELAALPLFAAAHAVAWLARLPTVLDAGESTMDADWLVRLRAKLIDHSRRQRDLVLSAIR
jgi:Ser/Thr protein kinase RdoA (MazF antagonist)